MCGICGFTGATDDAVTRAILQAMCAAMAHRGPDGEGGFIDGGIALGHRRLALIDLEGGSQPMGYRGRWTIVFNGEIYNYRELREELQAAGFRFETDSDTEVLLAGYAAWGEQVLQRLRGMFAFAIFDAKTRELFCARDFFGIKPFYYTVADGHFIFASEIKVILEHPAYEREFNEEALGQYLCFQFSALPETFFKGVFKLMPGHFLRVGADGSVTIERYWQPEYMRDTERGHEETVQAIEQVMRESVRYHNIADVEVGSFLSSGIDSSYLTALLTRENPAIKTFTVGFAEYEGERDEVAWAQELAQRLGIMNDAERISEADYWSAVPLVQWHMDEPSADPSAVALYFVDKLAAKRVKAVLSGEGADEFFAGYRVYQAALASHHAGKLPHGLLHAAAGVLRSAHLRGANYLERASQQVEDWYYTNANGVAFTVRERERLLSPQLRERLAGLPTPQELTAPVYAEVGGMDDVARMQHVDLWFWLAGDILLKTDKMSMAHSLESRVPFLDRGVFELAASIPTELKIDEHQTKIVLREAAQASIPASWAQKEKLGFPVPMAMWLREERYLSLVRDEFTSPEAACFFDPDELQKLLDAHVAGIDESRRIWIIYSFLLWYHIYFIDRRKPESLH